LFAGCLFLLLNVLSIHVLNFYPRFFVIFDLCCYYFYFELMFKYFITFTNLVQ
jgi:hypothetical protein